MASLILIVDISVDGTKFSSYRSQINRPVTPKSTQFIMIVSETSGI